ncbi:hypothetical protein QJS04_geneDACA014991 [Acorus gramineus]|uniref:RRM domain-containing protein n=1 Tax=Acorus gramineus TaxID=55184 RepID=A0AAV9AM57_ACOGR|nr:hypothetical protein QJS04_geneDACA014991 [Acorus gramineus]
MLDPASFARRSEDRAPRANFPGHSSSDGPALGFQHLWGNSDLHGASLDYPQNDILLRRAYGLEDVSSMGTHTPPTVGGGPIAVVGIKPIITDIEPPNSLRRSAGPLADESNILFVDGLPTDCTRREVAHLFRPFIGFKEIRIIHKEPRQSGDKSRVLCFVEFNDAKCALIALEALQGYKFDHRKPDAPVLKIQFVQFPFHPPSSS